MIFKKLTRQVRIKLDGGNDQIFFPGASVSGVVEYRSPAMDLLMSLNLVIRGVSKTFALPGPKSYQEHVELFHVAEVLLPAPLRAAARTTYTWDFSFVLPMLTGPDRSSNVYLDAANPMFEEHPHALPPSMDSDQSKATQIQYHMYAVASRSCTGSLSVSQSWEQPVVFNIDNVRYLPDVHAPPAEPPQRLERPFRVLLPAGRQRQLLSPSLSDTGQSYMLVAHMPTSLVLGQELLVHLQVLPFQSNLPEAGGCDSPKAEMVAVASLDLHAYTHRRSAKHRHSTELTEVRAVPLPIRPGSAVIALRSGRQDLGFRTLKYQSWPPSFKSYSVSRSYSLNLEVEVEYENQHRRLRFDAPVRVVRKVSREAALARARSHEPPPPLPFLGPRQEGEELPPYEAVARSAPHARR